MKFDWILDHSVALYDVYVVSFFFYSLPLLVANRDTHGKGEVDKVSYNLCVLYVAIFVH